MQRILFFLMLISQVSWAQSGLLSDTSEIVVVTARREAVENFQLSESVAVLSRKELERQVSRSSAEALMGTPGVWMQKTNHGGGSPFVRRGQPQSSAMQKRILGRSAEYEEPQNTAEMIKRKYFITNVLRENWLGSFPIS